MIYTNLFKPNKAHKSKEKMHYLVESKKYKFSIIFDRKLISIVSGIAIGTLAIGVVNVSLYTFITYNNSNKLEELSIENGKYESAVAQLESQKSTYLKHKENAENIFNISDKPTKWSSIIESIAEQLPYDSVLTSIKTINNEDLKLPGVSTNQSSNNNQSANNNQSTNNNQNSNNNQNGQNTSNNSSNQNNTSANSQGSQNSSNNSNGANKDNQNNMSENSDIITNNIILIEGKSLSMVNISLFLDKLDKLDIFSKVECSQAQRADDSVYYDFTIYATLN